MEKSLIIIGNYNLMTPLNDQFMLSLFSYNELYRDFNPKTSPNPNRITSIHLFSLGEVEKEEFFTKKKDKYQEETRRVSLNLAKMFPFHGVITHTKGSIMFRPNTTKGYKFKVENGEIIHVERVLSSKQESENIRPDYTIKLVRFEPIRQIEIFHPNKIIAYRKDENIPVYENLIQDEYQVTMCTCSDFELINDESEDELAYMIF